MSQANKGLARHLEGWQPAVLAVGIAGISAWLAVPRPVLPRDVPLPEIDRRELRLTLREDDARAAAAERSPLPYAARAVGDALRALARDPQGTAPELISARAETARKDLGDEPLLSLRAVQARLFVRALAHWGRTGETTRDLQELGGTTFVDRGLSAGWLRAPHTVVLDDETWTVLFRVRWDELTGLREVFPFRPSLDEWRAYYGTLLAHPEGQGSASVRLSYALALARRDPDYPGDFARGVLAFQSGAFSDAAGAFEAHLTSHPEGAYHLRAVNHLLAARALAEASDETLVGE